MKSRQKVTIGVLVVAAAVAYLMITGFSTASQQVSIKDMLARGQELGGQYLLTEGTLLQDTVQWDSQKIELRFSLADFEEPDKLLPVVYEGIKPDNFSQGTQAVVEGYYDPQAGVFKAEKLTTKCPSKYEAATGGGTPAK
ncbi:MAG: cytochrome c maturation protein CcmE [Clostridia bacterium]|nr:MAG: cytochrome c maturation protein CcmE [Clostridia bacterium]